MDFTKPPQRAVAERYNRQNSQQIFVRQQEPVIQFTLAGLQHLYVNANMINQEYAFLKCQYFEFPLFDDIAGILGDYIPINFEIRSLWLTADRSQNFYETYGIDMRIRLQTKNLNMQEIALNLKDALLTNTFSIITGQASRSQLTAIGFLKMLQDLYFDATTSKLTIQLRPNPNNLYTIIDENQIEYYPAGFSIKISEPKNEPIQYTKTQAQLLNAIFGGTMVEGQNQFWSVMSDNVYMLNQEGFQFVYETMNEFPLFYKYSLLKSNLWTGTSIELTQIMRMTKTSRLCIDDMVYLRGPPETDTWTNLGSKVNILAALPRNKQYASTQNIQSSFLTTSVPRVKTSLAAIRSMNIQLCDSNGELIKFGAEFSLQLLVDFDIENDK